MLNVARLNVKAQKDQAEAEQQGADVKGSDRQGKKRTSDRNKSGGANAISECPRQNIITLLFCNILDLFKSEHF